MLSDEALKNATVVDSLRYSANVLNTNLSPSLRPQNQNEDTKGQA